jgi:hypothetical protein
MIAQSKGRSHDHGDAFGLVWIDPTFDLDGKAFSRSFH